MKELSLTGLFREIGIRAAEVEMQERVLLEAGAKAIQKQAKAEIGHYQQASGPFERWQPLADSTVAEKERLGYAPPDNPLLREGNLRDSIEYTVGSMEAHIGSNEDVAVWQELGTHGPNPGPDGYHVPPRSFLGSAAYQMRDPVGRAIGLAVASVFFGGSKRIKISGPDAVD